MGPSVLTGSGADGEHTSLHPDIVSAVVRAVHARRHELLKLTRALIACRTDSQSEGNLEFETEARRCQDIVASWLSDLGAIVQRWDESPRYPIVAGKLPGSGRGNSLAFNGHVDVVPVGDAIGWTYSPWEGVTASGRLWGRDAADMKGGVAAALVAMRAVTDAAVPLRGDLWAHIVSDEEVVGRGTRKLLRRLPAVDTVLVAEPTELLVMPVEGGWSISGSKSMAARATPGTATSRSTPAARAEAPGSTPSKRGSALLPPSRIWNASGAICGATRCSPRDSTPSRRGSSSAVRAAAETVDST